ncbi:hypothetical protein [Actinoplanes sp. NPDC089786]|uniref:hypothetical protein n=1 Tax=Actinoplanes sp. NPDC089786 TaxID=3155185 RepID=UPI0034243142
MRLQRLGGNAAVTRMVQRKPLDEKDDPGRYTSDAGHTFDAEGLIRREVHGLKYGVKGGFAGSYPTKNHPEGEDSSEKSMTKESPDRMAVVIMPSAKLAEGTPVQVVLHFHGWGFRGGTDPYAGYLVATGRSSVARKGTVRDVDQEHWEQQMGAVGKERAARTPKEPVVVAVLAQGRGTSDFGDLPTFDYLKDVFSKVPELSGVTNYSLIQTGHSGGGYDVAGNLGRGEAKTADPKATPTPADMVVMFDAEAIGKVTEWAIGHVNTLAKLIVDTTPKPADKPKAGDAQQPGDAQKAADALKAEAEAAEAQRQVVKAAIAATPKFRAYFAKGQSYDSAYRAADKALTKAINRVPAPWGWFPSPDVVVADLFRFIEVAGVTHEFVISKGQNEDAAAQKDGALADALRAETDPTIDRAKGLGQPPAAPARKKK